MGTGPGMGPGPARAAQSGPGAAVCSWPPAVCPCLPLAGLPQGSCPHICIFPALPAVIGGSSARLVPALLRAPLLPLPLPAPLAASVLGIFGKVPGAPQTLPGQGCLEEPPRPRSGEDRGGRSCQEGRKEPPEEFQSETRPRLPAAALAPAWGLGAGVGSALFGPRHGPEEASGGESPCTAPARCLPAAFAFPPRDRAGKLGHRELGAGCGCLVNERPGSSSARLGGAPCCCSGGLGGSSPLGWCKPAVFVSCLVK